MLDCYTVSDLRFLLEIQGILPETSSNLSDQRAVPDSFFQILIVLGMYNFVLWVNISPRPAISMAVRRVPKRPSEVNTAGISSVTMGSSISDTKWITPLSACRSAFFTALPFTVTNPWNDESIKVHIFWEGHKIFALLLTVCSVVKSKGKISHNFVAFSENMNFTI